MSLMLIIKVHHFFLFRKINDLYFNEFKRHFESKNGLISSLHEISNTTSDLLLKRFVKIFVFEVYLFRCFLGMFFVIVIYNFIN